MSRLVAEYGAVDALLSIVTDELSPDEQRISVLGSEHDFFSGSDKLTAFASIAVLIAGVVSFIEFQARPIAVAG